MFFPIRDDNPRLRPPVVMKIVVAINILVWLIWQGAGTEPAFVSSLCNFGAIPGELTGRAAGDIVNLGDAQCVIASQPHWYTLVTSMFLHGGWLHLIGNMWFLWVFGDNVEDEFGHIGFIVLYLFCGLVAAATQIVTAPSAEMPMVGASGAISGVLGAYIVMFPKVRVQTLVFLGIFITMIRVPAYLMLGYWIVIQVLGALPQLGGGEGGVAFWAHVGGFAAGALIAALSGRTAGRVAAHAQTIARSS
jgi:membrane associated rhomboid family serine protease